ncbi:MAG: DUF2442 domain-containing protein [Prevotellaceae bacterium]|nr:DUF2442 domain-containing protein [Prevotellaceae bacterium]
MNPRIKDVVSAQDYTLHLWFKNGEEGIFDMKPYLNYNMFKPLRDVDVFNTVQPSHGTIQWANDADLCPDTVYMESLKI